MITHTVTFRLKHKQGSPEEVNFLQACQDLAEIPGVQNFQRLKQVSVKNNFTHGLSMDFVDEAAYQAYNDHPTHVSFVQNRWIPEVDDFLEIDYEAYEA